MDDLHAAGMLDRPIHPAHAGRPDPEMMGYADDKLFNRRDTRLNEPAARQLIGIAALNPSYDLSIYARGTDWAQQSDSYR